MATPQTIQAREGVQVDGNNLNVSNQVMAQLSPAQIKAAERLGFKVNPTLDAIRAAKAKTTQPASIGIGPTTTIVKNPDGTTTTTTAPGYGSQSVGGASMGISSSGPTTTTSASQGTPSSVGNTAGTGIGAKGEEFNKKKMWDDTIDTATGLPVGYGKRELSIGEGMPPIQSTTTMGDTSGLTEPTPEEKAASGQYFGPNEGKGDTTNKPTGDTIDTSTGLPVSESGKKKPIDESKPTTDIQTGVVVPVMPQSEDEAFTILQNGGKLPVNKQAAIWENRYAHFQDLNSQDSNTIAGMVASGDIAPRYLDYLRKYSPSKYSEVEKKYNDDAAVNSINSSSQNLFDTIVGDTKKDEPTRSQQIQLEMIKEFNATPPSIRDLKAKYYEGNDALKESKIKMAEMESEIETTKEEISKIYETYRTQYPDAPQAFIVGMAEKAASALNQKLTREIKEYNIEYARYKAEKEDIDTELKFDEMLIKEERDNRAEKLGFLKDLYTGAKSDEDWERSKEFEIQKIKDAQAYGDKQAEQAHTWKLAEIENAQNFQREEMGFQAEQNRLQREQAMEIVQLQMKNSGRQVVGEAPDGSWYDIMDKDGNITRKTADELVQNAPPPPGTYKPGNTNISFSTDDNGDTTFAIQGYGTGSIMMKEDGKPAECAGFTNRVTGEYGLMKDYYSDKAAQIDTQDPQAGDVFVSRVGVKNENKDYGHVGLVNKVVRNPDGSIKGLWISDANAKLDNKIRNNVYITKGDKIFDTITGYHRPNYKKGVEKAQVAILSDRDVNSGIESLAAKVNKMTGKNEKELLEGLSGKILDYGIGSPDVRDYIYSTVAETIEGEAGKNYLNTGSLIKTLGSIKGDIQAYQNKYPDSGGIADAVGMAIQYKVNAARGKPNPPQIKEAYALMDRITREMQLYRQNTTGAAFGLKEMAEFKELFPLTKFGGDVKVSKTLTLDKIDNLIKISQTQLDSTAELILGPSAFKKIMYNQQPKVNINNLTVDRNFMTSTPSKEKYGYEDWASSLWFTNYFN